MEMHKLLWVLGLSVLLCSGIVFAQTTTGAISGTVKDSTGAVLPGTKVVILNEETGLFRTVQTDEVGHYSALSLRLGNYRVTGTLEGFQTEVRTGIVLTVGREAVVDLALAVGAVTEKVEITAEAPLVESTSASLGSLVDDRTIRALPLNGRSYDQLALLQPGVILTNPSLGSTPSMNLGTGKRFSVGGQRSVSNSFLLDGTNINDWGNGTPGGAAGLNLGVDTIQEFKIFTSAFKAEYGHSSGGVVTSVTRSGTNTFHGTAFEYIRNSALDARNFFDVGSSPPSFRRNQFGGVLGGPIKKDKTFFFGGYEGLRQGLGTTLIATVPTALARQGILPTGTVPVNPAILPYLKLYPLPNGRDFGDGTGEFLSAPTVVANEDNFMVRVDHQLNDKTGIFGRYTIDKDILNAPGSLPRFVVPLESRRQYSTIQANSILGPKVLNNFRFAFNRTHSLSDHLILPDPAPEGAFIIPGQPFGGITVAGSNSSNSVRAITALGGGTANGAGVWAYNILEWGDDFNYVTGKHTLKTGVDIQRLRDNTVLGTGGYRGSYNFLLFNDFLAAKPSLLQAGFPLGDIPYLGMRQSLYAVYGQDDYTVNSRLTLNLGLRWETVTDPKEVHDRMSTFPSPAATAVVISDRFFSIGKKNFEPRLGIAWRLDSSGKTVLRAGAGIYHNQILPWAYWLQVLQPPFFSSLRATNPSFPSGYLELKPGTALPGLNVMAPTLKTPVNDQYNLSIQRELFRNTVVQVAYAGSKSNHLMTQREADTAVPIILSDGRKFFPAGVPRRNPAWAAISMNDMDANSVYNSLTVTLRRQSPSGFQGQIFYTYSKSMDEASGAQSSENHRSPKGLMDPEDRRRDWGLSDFDSKHAIVANFSYPFPLRVGSKALGAVVNDWSLDGIGTFTAGLPFTAILVSAVSRDQSNILAERPDLKPGSSQNPNHGTSVGCAGFPAGKKLGGADNFYDPCSFSLPLAGTYGNLGRTTIIGPGVADLDLALEKRFKLREEADVTFKAEVFNIMNHANFDLPNGAPLLAGGAASAAAGRITGTTTSSRQIQFALRINF